MAETSRQPCDRDDALHVVRRLRDAGHIAYFAGGCVRDLLLGMTPKDFDVATDAPPTRVREIFRNSQSVGAAFGVILVRHNRSSVEVATFRTDGRYLDGRRPSSVQFTDAEHDARRRDFTINGLFLDPIDDRVIDYVGGQADIAKRLVRAIGNPAERFDEDTLRLLRAARFSARLAFSVETSTADAIRAHAPQLRRISPERVADELRLMLTPTTRNHAWQLLWDFNLVYEIFRFLPLESDRPTGTGDFLFFHLAPPSEISFSLAMAAGAICYQRRLADDASALLPLLAPQRVAAAVHALRQALKLSNEETDAIGAILTSAGILLADAPPTVAQLRRFLGERHSPDARHLLAAITSAGLFSERIATMNRRLDELALHEISPTPLLDGKSLIAAGLRPGPLFRELIEAVYDAQLEGRVSTTEEALALAMNLTTATKSRD